MAELKQANLLIYRSPNGRGTWALVKPEDVPAWLKVPEVMAALVRGEAACKSDEGESGSDWYVARKVEDVRRELRAAAKRERRAAKRRTLH